MATFKSVDIMRTGISIFSILISSLLYSQSDTAHNSSITDVLELFDGDYYTYEVHDIYSSKYLYVKEDRVCIEIQKSHGFLFACGGYNQKMIPEFQLNESYSRELIDSYNNHPNDYLWDYSLFSGEIKAIRIYPRKASVQFKRSKIILKRE